MKKMTTKQLTLDAMLSALCAVLGYIALDMQFIKLTFESIPVIIGALLFGPLDGALIGGIGTLIYQLIRYGISATTILWMLPYIITGFLLGLYAKKKHFVIERKEYFALIAINELLIMLLNTAVMYIDSKMYGYYSFAYIFGSFFIRLIIALAKSIIFAIILPSLITILKPIVNPERTVNEE